MGEPDEGPALGDELVRIRQLVNRLEALFQRRLARFDRDGGPAAEGALSTGCDRPAGWCEGHHVRHWADGGPSTLENTALYRRRHHGLLFHDGLRKYKPPG